MRSFARNKLGATEEVLSTLACERTRNPRNRRAAPMRLYKPQEVQEAVRKAVQKAEADKQYREDHRDITEAEKLSKQKKAAKQKADTAAQACAQFSTHPPTKLPLDVWRSILEESDANPLRSVQNTLHADIPWDQVVSDPLSLKNDVLKKACKSVGEQSSGTKAVLVLRLLKFFGVDRPCAVPAVLLLAVKHGKILSCPLVGQDLATNTVQSAH